MKEGMRNAGQKARRQFNQLLDKEVKEGRPAYKDAKAHTDGRQHKVVSQKGR